MLAVVGVATDGQLIRLCLELSSAERNANNKPENRQKLYAEVLNEAEKLASVSGYLKKICDVNLPRQMGGGVVNVWHLTEKGLKAANVVDPLFTRYAFAGLPCGNKIERIPHELAVTESFLKLSERQIICDWLPERELKSRIMLRRYELLRQSVNPEWNNETSGEETGDARAVVLPLDQPTGRPFTVECEAAINYRRRQIEAKPNNMLWFVTSKMQKELVEAVKKERLKAVWVINSVHSPLENQTAKKATEKGKKSRGKRRRKLETKILQYLTNNVEAYTGKALACVLNEKLSNVSATLTRLVEGGEVSVTEIKLSPAVQRGRPNKLFWHSQYDKNLKLTRSERIKKLLLSEAICHFTASEYRLTEYSAMMSQARFSPLRVKEKQPLRVLIDNPELGKEELSKKWNLTGIKADTGEEKVIVAVSCDNRVKEIKELLRPYLIFNTERKQVMQMESVGR